MPLTTFFIELQSGKRVRLAALLRPDEHTSTYVRQELTRILHERYGANNESSIKTFRYQVGG